MNINKNKLSTVKESTVIRSLRMFSYSDKKKLIYVTIIQSTLGILDLFAIALVGFVGALAVKGIQSQQPGNKTLSILKLFKIENLSFQNQVTLLVLFSAFLFIIRTVFSVILNRKILFFLSRQGARITKELTSKLLSMPITSIDRETKQHHIYSLTYGVTKITLYMIGSLIAIFADVTLILILLFGLIIVNFFVALTSILFFGLLSIFLYKIMSKKSYFLGKKDTEYSIKINEKISEAISAYREIFVKNRENYYVNEIGLLSSKLSDVLAEYAFIPSLSKYVFEVALILGTVIVGAIQFFTVDATHAIATLAIFMAAGSRLAPAILRIQSNALQFRSATGSAISTLNLYEYNKVVNKTLKNFTSNHFNFFPTVSLEKLSYTYPDRNEPSLININLEVAAGEFVAVVGPSGAGKTTLVDIILGIKKPVKGNVKIGGQDVSETLDKWPGAISYVPQSVSVFNGSFRENISIGYSADEIADTLIIDSLKFVSLYDFILSLDDGINAKIGENGANLSGGQKQRLGIARAMISKPKLLILDEATSALDGQTELDISESLNDLKKEMTLIVVAHRLSTVRKADKVVYLENGKIVCSGTFEEVRKNVPNFEKQASLMGL